jgi:hypothetical protein
MRESEEVTMVEVFDRRDGWVELKFVPERLHGEPWWMVASSFFKIMTSSYKANSRFG